MREIFSKKLVIFYGLFLFCNFLIYAQGKERWQIKTLNDTLNYQIDSVPIKTNVGELNKIIRPNGIRNSTPRLSEEKKTYIIDCVVLDYKKQEDGDYHLVVSDLNNYTNYTIIVESVLPRYVNKKYYTKIKKTRDFILRKINKKQLKGYSFKIKGIAFFDLIHNQKGKAINDLELHPILEIKSLN